MKNHYLFIASDSENPSYYGAYIMHHPTRSNAELKADFHRLRDIHIKNSREWCIGDIMRDMENHGWKIVDMPEVNVTY